MTIPGIPPFDISQHPNPQNGTDTLHYSVLVVGYALPSGPRSQAQMAQIVGTVRSELAQLDTFLAENSYGRLKLDMRIRSFAAQHPRSWTGNAPTAQYDSSGDLSNATQFPSLANYTGYSGLTVLANTKDDTVFRDYPWRLGYGSVCLDAIAALANSPVPAHDDAITMQQWMHFGTTQDAKSTVLVVSPDIKGGFVRPLTLRQPVAFGRAFGFVAASESGSTGKMATIIHELFHTLAPKGLPDLYGRDNAIGDLYDVSIMGQHRHLTHLDALLKMQMGWTEPRRLAPFKGRRVMELSPVYGDPKNTLLLRPDSLGRPEEFFLLEVRDAAGADANGAPIAFDQTFEPGQAGVLAYHVDTAADVTPADPRVDLEGESPGVKGRCVPGRFGPHGAPAFLSYDDETGLAAFYTVSASGVAKRLGPVHSRMRKSWHTVIAVDLGRNIEAILFYDREHGQLNLCTTDGAGGISQYGPTVSSVRKSWDLLIAGKFFGAERAGVLFYDRSAGHGEFWSFETTGGMQREGPTRTGWRKSWTHIVSGRFGGGSNADLLFYDASSGQAEFYATKPGLKFTRIGARSRRWQRGYDIIAAGTLPDGAPNDGVVCFDRASKFADAWSNPSAAGPLVRFGRQATLGSRRTWTTFNLADYTGAGSDELLLYDAGRGHVQLYGFGATGNFRSAGHHFFNPLQVGEGLEPYQTKLHDQAIHTGLRIGVRAGAGHARQVEISWEIPAGQADILSVNDDYETARLAHHDTWRKTWRIHAGRFLGATQADLLLYDAAQGYAELHHVSASGSLQLKKRFTTWRKTWTSIVTGEFGGTAHGDLLFYDAAAGEGEFYSQSGGKLTRLATHTGWRPSWKYIVSGNFDRSPCSALLFYDAAARHGQFHTVRPGGKIYPLGAIHTGWRPSWHTILSGSFGGTNGCDDLLFYDRDAGFAQFYSADGRGGMRRLGAPHRAWRKTWDVIAAFSPPFGGTHILFYDGTNGVLQVYEVTGPGRLSPRRRFEDVSHAWDAVVPLILPSGAAGLLTYRGT